MYASSMKLVVTLALLAALSAASTGQSLQTAPSIQKADPHGLYPAPSVEPSASTDASDSQRAGTDGDLVLLSQVNGAGDPWAGRKGATKGDQVSFGVYSPGQTLKAPVLLIQLYRSGAMPRSPYPGIAIDPSLESALFLIEESERYPSAGPDLGFTGVLEVAPQLSGSSMLMQGFSMTALARNEIFESTDAHEIVIQ